jgi:hypothetical protein
MDRDAPTVVSMAYRSAMAQAASPSQVLQQCSGLGWSIEARHCTDESKPVVFDICEVESASKLPYHRRSPRIQSLYSASIDRELRAVRKLLPCTIVLSSFVVEKYGVTATRTLERSCRQSTCPLRLSHKCFRSECTDHAYSSQMLHANCLNRREVCA